MNFNDLRGLAKKKIKSVLRRNRVTKLWPKMEEIRFDIAPASTKRHLCCRGGLMIHSALVATKAEEIFLHLGEDYTYTKDMEVTAIARSAALCGALHDIGKANDYYLINAPDEAIKRGASYSYNKRKCLPHSILSGLILEKWNDILTLNNDETTAIICHDGMYAAHIAPYLPGNETPLMLCLHWADMWSSRVLEDNLNDQSAGFGDDYKPENISIVVEEIAEGWKHE